MSILGDLASATRGLGPLGEATVRGLELYGKALGATERLALQVLRSRMDTVAPLKRLATPDNGTHDSAAPGEVMAQLLERSLAQDARSGRREADVSVVRQLAPDEARIIATLAKGEPAPLIHVQARAGGHRILENASLIGRMAGATLPSQTPSYVTHLHQLGLVEMGPEDPANRQGYELLMADRDVRAALKQGELSKLPARTIKRTLVLSERGRALWAACQE